MPQSGIQCNCANQAVCAAVEEWFESRKREGAVGQFRGVVNDSDNRPGAILVSIESSGGPTNNPDAPMQWSDSSEELVEFLRRRGFTAL